MADLKTTTVTGDLTVSGQGKASGGAVVEGGDLTLYQPSTGDSPGLIFRRGTLSDNYNDWQIQDRSGLLYFDQRGNGSSSWTNVCSIGMTGAVTCQSVTISAAPTSNMQVANKKYVDDAVAGASSPVDVFAATIAISGVALDTATITLSNSKTVADLYGSKPAALYIKGFNSATSIDFNVLMLLNVDDYSPSTSKIDGIAYCGGGKQLAIAGTFAKTSTTITGTLTNTPKAPKTATVTLAMDSWSGTIDGYMQTVTVTGMTASAIVWVAPAYATLYNYAQMYTTDKIVCASQAADSLTFRRYANTSSGNIDVNITWIT